MTCCPKNLGSNTPLSISIWISKCCYIFLLRSAFTRAFPDVPTHDPAMDPPPPAQPPPKIHKQTSSSASSIISGRPAISRHQRPSISSAEGAAGSGAGVIGSFNRGTTASTTTSSINADKRLVLNDTVISDPHNSLSSECR